MSDDWNSHSVVLKLLEKFFCWNGTLKEYLELICKSENVDKEKREEIIGGKCAEYQKHLTDVVVACGCTDQVLPRLRSHVSFSASCSLDDVIYHVLGVYCKKDKQAGNLLSIGSTISRHDSFRGCMSLQSNIQCDYPNSMVSFIMSSTWENLLSRIGEDIVIHLLGKLTLFMKMPNGCLMQLCGQPIGKLEPKNSNHKCNQINLPGFSFKFDEEIESSSKNQQPGLCKFASEAQKNDSCSSKYVRNTQNMNFVGAHDKICNRFTKLKAKDYINIKEKDCRAIIKVGFEDLVNSQAPDKRTQPQYAETMLGRKRKREEGNSGASNSNKGCGSGVMNVKNQSACAEGFNDKRRRICGNNKYSLDEKQSVKKTQCHKQNEICLDALCCKKLPLKEKEQDAQSMNSIRKRKLSSDVGNYSLEPPKKRTYAKDSTCSDKTGQCSNIAGGKTGEIRNAFTINDPKITNMTNNTVQLVDSEASLKATDTGKSKDISNTGMSVTKNKLESVSQQIGAFATKSAIPQRKKCANTSENANRCSISRIPNKKNMYQLSEPFKISSILYSLSTLEKLRKSHILMCVNDSKKDAEKLVADIFISENRKVVSDHTTLVNNVKDNSNNACKNSSDKPNTTEVNSLKLNPKLPRNLLKTVKFFRDFIRRFKKLKIKAVLARICPVSASLKELLRNPEKDSEKDEQKSTKNAGFTRYQQQLYKTACVDFTPPEKVASFIKDVCNKTVPKTLLGSKANWKTFYDHVRKLLELRMHESMTLLQFMHGIRISDCTWMLKNGVKPKQIPISLSEWQSMIQYKLVYWLVRNYILPLVGAYFYVTESALHRKRLFYYRKPVWKIIDKLGKDIFLQSNLTEVNESDIEKSTGEKAVNISSTIRIIPKKNKTRPILNLHRTFSKDGVRTRQSANQELKSLFNVLTFVQGQERTLTGSAVFGMDDVNIKLREYIAELRKNNQNHLPKYWVASDIDNCFDSIPHDKLIHVIDKSISNSSYTIRKFTTVTRDGESKVKIETKQLASDDADCDYFPVFLHKHLLSKKLKISNAIIADKVYYSTEDKDDLMSLLIKQIKNSFIKIDKKYYQRVRGIAQGSILSTILANFIYGDMERLHFGDILSSNNSLLMRWTDDFLLVTTSRETAVSFLKSLQAGYPDYGCKINVSKSLTNLPRGALGTTDKIKRLEGDWFPWCGLLFNTNTLNVRMSFDRNEGEFISDSITQKQEKAPGKQLVSRLLRQVRNKSMSLILDPAINSLYNIKLNIYQVFSFLAVKLHSQVLSVPKHRQPNCNPVFYRRLINKLFNAFYSQYERVKKRLKLKKIPISRTEAKGLCLGAVLDILGRKQCRYRLLLKSLRKSFKKIKINKEEFSVYEKESEIIKSIR